MAEVIMPKMGDAMTEGKVLRWIKQQGDAVRKGEPIVEIETDKVNVDLEAEWDGTLAQLLVGAGEVAPVGAPIALIARPGEQVERPAPTGPGASAAAPGSGAATAALGPTAPPARRSQAPAAPAEAARAAPPAAGPPDGTGAVRASPLARKLAEQHGISLATIRGTGPDGRVTKEDVEATIAAGMQRGAPAPAAAPTAAGVKEVPLTRMRATIARRMTESKQHAPHFYVTVAVTMDPALEARRRLNDRLGADRKVSINDVVIKATALALVKYPNLNASFGGDAIRHPGEINISMAVPLPEGLISPTLHGCDRKPVWQIGEEARALIERARAGHFKPEDLSGGTFTVSNLGSFNVDSFVAIINPPQTAILAVGTAKPSAVVKDGKVGVATVMQSTLSADHRVTDGAEAAAFLVELKRLLENPAWIDAETA